MMGLARVDEGGSPVVCCLLTGDGVEVYVLMEVGCMRLLQDTDSRNISKPLICHRRTLKKTSAATVGSMAPYRPNAAPFSWGILLGLEPIINFQLRLTLKIDHMHYSSRVRGK